MKNNNKIIRRFTRIKNSLVSSRKRNPGTGAKANEGVAYQELFENMGSCGAIYQVVGEGKEFVFKDFNKAAEKVEKIKKEELLGRNVRDVFPGVKEFGLLDVFERVWKTGKAEHFPLVFYQDNRVSGWKENFVYKLPSGDIVAVYNDVTETKKYEELLKRFDFAMRQSIDGVIMGDLQHTFTYVNPAFADMHGYKPEELIGKNMDSVYSDEHLQEFREREALIRATGYWKGEVYHKKKDGTSFPAFMSVTAIKDLFSKPTGMLGICRDISDQKALEKEREAMRSQVHQVEKMQAISTLAGGLAHDFNNILSAIRGLADLVMLEMDSHSSLYPDIAAIRQNSIKASGLIRQLLFFTSSQPLTSSRVNVNDIVRKNLPALEHIFDKKITILTELDSRIDSIKSDSGMIEQVLMNIADNSKNAMARGGTFIIKTESCIFSKEDILKHPEAYPGKFLCMTISDTGVGMSSEIKKRVFEPYFTKQNFEKKTGLGLPVVYSIIKQLRGWIHLRSIPGEGTEIKLYIPFAPEEKGGREGEAISLDTIMGRGEKILLVEGDDILRSVVKRILEKNKYIVLEASNAEQATELFKRENGAFDLVVTGIMFPGKDGLNMVKDFLVKKQNLKVLLSSGHPLNETLWNEIKQKDFPFLQKPYNLTDLLAAIKRIIH